MLELHVEPFALFRAGDVVNWDRDEWRIDKVNYDSHGQISSLHLSRPGEVTCVRPEHLEAEIDRARG